MMMNSISWHSCSVLIYSFLPNAHFAKRHRPYSLCSFFVCRSRMAKDFSMSRGRTLIAEQRNETNWRQFSLFLSYAPDPRQWTPEHVLIWLNWAKKEFSLEINSFEAFFKMHGRDIVGLGREGFLAVAPLYTGDILWEHLEILLKGKS
jgi:hypothetical protein